MSMSVQSQVRRMSLGFEVSTYHMATEGSMDGLDSTGGSSDDSNSVIEYINVPTTVAAPSPENDEPHPLVRRINVQEEDEQLGRAARESVQSGSLLPIIKQELKYRILSKRLTKGETEIIPDFTPKQPQPLREDEILRRQSRQASNRRSARRCRLKQKKDIIKIKEELQSEQQRKNRLLQVLQKLTKEKQVLSSKLPSALTEMCQFTADLSRCGQHSTSRTGQLDIDIAASELELVVS